MDFSQTNCRPSIHQRLVAGFVRRGSGDLVQCFGPLQTAISSKWPEVRQRLLQSPCHHEFPKRLSQTTLQVELGLGTSKGCFPDQNQPSASSCLVFETLDHPTQQILGIILAANETAGLSPGAQMEQAHVDGFFASLILGNMRIGTAIDRELIQRIDVEASTDSIVDLFDRTLRYESSCDKWGQGGRSVFRESVSHFTRRGQAVEFCLPAFPCKSSSTGKVLSKAPDLGEYLALENMHNFLLDIEAIYEPGAKLWIISDGHVFSDCIGVDDDVVDRYGARLQAMNQDIVRLQGGKERIGFRSLPQLFASHCSSGGELAGARETYNMLPDLVHHIATKMTCEAEMCRKILMMGFQLDDAELRNMLSAQDASMIALYRGFSKFMLEDLTTNKYTSHLSRSQLRKKSAKVAFEMMQRNQAYSNLVQILFPHHVRLSIHAHDNAGPKFGIQMLGRDVVPTDVLPPNGSDSNSCDKLHVPTPWHNCIVEIRGDASLYITKSSVAHAALASGQYRGRLHEFLGQGEFVYLIPRRRS
ncbi:hypothetical protein E4U42_007686 [Claviceps africana]|uniref:Uncharacterized protein n=1 Tax=Claviceps africana TaxID=83212 RepID=A0A8K0J1G4_9HYPO|nr:hypothetical protein E4U42_007686 [Claviceps africana]